MARDLRLALRLLARSPGFTAISVLSLALGIGANAAIFSLVDAALLRPLPVDDPSRLVSIYTTDDRNPGTLPLSDLNYQDLRAQAGVFEGVAAVAFTQMNWARGTDDAEPVAVQVVSDNFFPVVGAPLAHGRGFVTGEDRAASPVAVLSYAFWERHFDADAGVVGRVITLNREPFTIIGVAARGFAGTQLGVGPAVWIPLSMHAVAQPGFDWYGQRRGLFLQVIGRLAPDASTAQADAVVRTAGAQLAAAFPTDNAGRTFGARSLLDARLDPTGVNGPAVRRLSGTLMTVVGIVLLIACANLTSLLLARTARRRKEIAVRLAIGASRARVVRQLLAESLLLAAAGGAAGLLLAQWLLAALAAVNVNLPLPVAGVTVDGRVLAFTVGLVLTSGLLVGLAPALQASRPDLLSALKSGIGGGAREGRPGASPVRTVLVAGQVALCLVALVTAGLFLRSFNALIGTDTGFETRGVLVLNVNLGREGYTEARGRVFHTRVVERVSAVPGVRAVALARNAPLGGGIRRTVFAEGADTTTRERQLIQVNDVSPAYFDAAGIPLTRGRAFTTADDPAHPKVAIVNETMAARFWPGEDPVGKRFTFFGETDLTTVVGVARTSVYNAVMETPAPFIYTPLAQNYASATVLHVRTEEDAAALGAAVRAAVKDLDPSLAVFNVRTLRDQVATSLTPLRVNVVALSTFGTLAVLLAAIGLYGVAAQAVSQRTREIGVRMALGASPRQALALVLRQSLRVVAGGLGAGLLLASVLTPLLPRDMLGSIGRHDPWTLAGTSLLLALVAVLATWLPARRATRIDPLVALRAD